MKLRLALAMAVLGILGWAAAKKPGDVEKGKIVFRQCSLCHRADTTEAKMGPGLKGLFKRAKLADGQKCTEQTIRARIDNGGRGMPPYKEMLSEQEKEDVVAYLKTL